MSFFNDLDARLTREKPVKPIELEPAEEGDECADPKCRGRLAFAYPEDWGCSCHISPPCGRCTSSFLQCTECFDEPNGRDPA